MIKIELDFFNIFSCMTRLAWVVHNAISTKSLPEMQNKEYLLIMQRLTATSVAGWLVCSVLVLCCSCGEYSPPLSSSLSCSQLGKTLTRHFAMQTGMCFQSRSHGGSHVWQTNMWRRRWTASSIDLLD